MKYSPPVLLLPCSPSLSADKFKIGLIPMSQIIFYIKHNFVRGIQDRVKLHVLKDENCKRQNTVYWSFMVCWMIWIHWSQYSYIVNFQHGASASVQWVKNEIHNLLRMGISWWAKRLEPPPILMISQYIHVYGKCIYTACLLLLLYTIVWQMHSLS